jgi:hypothetical protein
VSAHDRALRPSLAALPRETQVNIAVADTQGVVWGACTAPGSPVARVPDPRYANANYGLPDYLNDPAAWGPLWERELNGLQKQTDGLAAAYWFSDKRAGPRILYGPWCASPGEAVAAATLAKHGIDWETLEARG